ncbi:MAG: hypothetical protein JXA73_08860 [Acidobacteria bacterium]|nr:hypothetical protein [Acidobacteriota bacterium]
MLIEATAALSGLAMLGSGINLLVNYRAKRDMALIQRDMAQLENKILAGINGKYISRREAEIISRERDRREAEIKKQIGELDSRIGEARKYHHELHEEFIECRAEHGGKS